MEDTTSDTFRIALVEPSTRTMDRFRKQFNKDYHFFGIDTFEHAVEYIESNTSISAILLRARQITGRKKQFLHHIKLKRPDVVLLLYGSVDSEKLMHYFELGLDHHVDDPINDAERFRDAVERLHKRKRSASPSASITQPTEIETDGLIGKSPCILQVRQLIEKVAPLDSTILLLGETGTGKEVVARLIHQNSPIHKNKFVAVHCGGIPDTLLESTLFGHEKGSFTGAYKSQKGYFESADGGAIFLDEIGDTTAAMQVKLLRVLQHKQFYRVGDTEPLTTSARIIAATNRDLRRMVEKDKFRQDLYYRLNVITIEIPPLREHPEDIPLLVQHFMKRYARKHNQMGIYLKSQTMDILKRYHWPGNVRELENVVERIIALSDTDWIGPRHLPRELTQKPNMTRFSAASIIPYSDAKSLFEREYIINLLQRTQGNISKAARLANMPRQNLHVKIKKYDLKTDSSEFIPEILHPVDNVN